MITPRARPQSLLQAIVKPNLFRQAQQIRSIHNVPDLSHGRRKEAIFAEHGVPGFLSKRTYDQAWVKYQQHLCDQINTWTTGTSEEDMGALNLHVKYAHSSAHAYLYNHAAMACHNAFFWKGLSDTATTPPEFFRKTLEDHFESMDNLRTLMLEAADAMFGNGFVWLMIDHSAERTPRILNTYNAGSPWPGAHRREQSVDAATSNMSERLQRMTVPQNYVGSFGSSSRYNSQQQPNALLATPILCVNVWQHMYVLDYGVLGKRQYLSAWWERIDWAQVADLYNTAPQQDNLLRGATALAGSAPRSFLST